MMKISLKPINILKRFSLVILLVTILIAAMGVTPAAANGGSTVKWVDQAGGSDANDGNTEGTAYATLQHAIDNSSSGTDVDRSIIYVKNGTYGVTGLTNQDGYSTAILIQNLDYLTIQAVSGHEPVVKPTVAANIVSISIENCDHLIIDNIDSDQTVVQFDNWHVFDSNDLTLRNSRFEGGEDGIDFNTDLTTCLIENNEFTNITTGSGDEVLDFTDETYSDVIIQENYFKYNYRAVTLNNAGGTVDGFKIRRNKMDGTNSEEAIRLIGASNVVVENNIIMNNMQQGVYIDSGCSNISILNNTFYNNDQEGAKNGEIRTKVTTADIVIKNNIIYGNGANPAFETSVASLPGEDYNFIFNTVDPGFTFGAHNIVGLDPEFYSTTPGSEDLHLWYCSAAINAGDDGAVIPGSTDYDGDSRIYGTVDMGADEYIPTSEVWIDDNWAGLNPGDPADSHTFGYDAFDSIQDGIDAVAGSTVNVAAGTYNEDVNIDKPGLTLQSVTEYGAVINGGIEVLNGADNAAIRGFSIRPASGYAIDVWRAGNVIVNGNEIIGQGPTGGANGIGYRHTSPASAGTVSNNIVEDCELGVYIDHDGLTDFRVTDNTFDNNRKAIGIGSASGALIAGNSIYNSTQMGIEIFKASLSKAHQNEIVGNALGVSNGDGVDDFDATNNWWGADSGPAHASNPAGTGDTITDKVLYDPWTSDPGSTDFEYIDDGGEATLNVDGSSVDVNMEDGESGGFSASAQAGTPGTGFTGMGNGKGIGSSIVVETDADDGDFIAVIKLHYTDQDLIDAGITEDDLRLYYYNTDVDPDVWMLAVAGNTGGTIRWMGNSAPPAAVAANLGMHGVYMANNIAWAVVDHTTDYSAGEGPDEAWVDDDWAALNPGDPADGHTYHADAFSTIQDAIDSCAAGATIHVYEGTYTEDLLVDKANMTIESLDAVADTIINGGGNPAIDIFSANVTIDGFTIDGDEDSGDRGIYLRNTQFTVQNNIFTGIANEAIIVESSLNTITSGLIENNNLTGLGANADYHRNGILLEGYSGNAIGGVTISNNTVSDYGTQDGTMEASGIKLADTGNGDITVITLSNNTISDCYWGLYLRGSLTGTSPMPINNSSISGCGTGVIITAEAGGEDCDSEFELNYNTITNNTVGVRFWDRWASGDLTGDKVINYNNISGNADYGVQNDYDDDVDARFNYWGSNTGPTHHSNPLGTGDDITDKVIYQPWLDNGQQPSSDFYIDAIAEANTEVIITGTGGHIVGAGRWSHNPDSAYPQFMVIGGYFIDVFATDITGISQIEIRFHYVDDDVLVGLEEQTFRMKWWDGTAWQDCSNTGVNTAENYVWAIITADTSPTLAELVGTPFSASGQRIIIPGMSTWGALVLAVLFLCGIVWVVRRKRLTADQL